jgi:hypothetical protein
MPDPRAAGPGHLPLTPLEQVHACLLEAGYPHVRIMDHGIAPDGGVLVGMMHGDAPVEVLYQAYRVCGITRRCWTHWSTQIGTVGDICDPAECDVWSPPRELLLVK